MSSLFLPKARPAGVPGWLATRLDDAARRLEAAGVPTSAREDWRYTRLGARTALAGRALPTRGVARPSARLEIIDGVWDSSRSCVPDALVVTTLADAVARELPGVTTLGAIADADEPSLHASLASFPTGLYVHVPAGRPVPGEVPLIELVISASRSGVTHTRVLIVAEAGAQVCVVERHQGHPGAERLAVTEVVVGAHATVDHVRLGLHGWIDSAPDAAEGVEFGTVAATIAAGGRFHSHVVSLGVGTSRTAVHATLRGAGAHAALRTLSATPAGCSHDHYTVIDHAVPGATSTQTTKSLIADGGVASVVARVLIGRGAVQSSANQSLKALLLGASAKANLKPQLEIDNDAVKAAHGAAIGRLDPLQLFFLRARGLDAATARALLIAGFVREVADTIPNAGLAGEVVRYVLGGLDLPSGLDGDDLSERDLDTVDGGEVHP
ncbi:MAG: SufD family Fe-S cluster assembly protein [Myxococcales bacterium]|nr:SufD family Fe-S cluster assembly protein [Myxococcales bacterium]